MVCQERSAANFLNAGKMLALPEWLLVALFICKDLEGMLAFIYRVAGGTGRICGPRAYPKSPLLARPRVKCVTYRDQDLSDRLSDSLSKHSLLGDDEVKSSSIYPADVSNEYAR